MLMGLEDPDAVGCAADRNRMSLQGSSCAQPQPAARVMVNVPGAHVSGAAGLTRSRADTAATTASAAVAHGDSGDGRLQCLEVASSLSSPATTRSAPAASTGDPPPPPPPRARKLPPSPWTPARAQGTGGGGLDASSASLAVPPCPQGSLGRNASIGACDSSEEGVATPSDSDSEVFGGIEAVAA